MPITTLWTDPEQLLEHQDVRVFHTYKEDDYEQGVQCYWFTVNPSCGELDQLCDDQPCHHVFDVRQLRTWKPPEQPPFCSGTNDNPENRAAWEQYWELEGAAVQSAIITAIDCGELTQRGWAEGAERQGQQPPPNPAPGGASPADVGASIPEKNPAQS